MATKKNLIEHISHNINQIKIEDIEEAVDLILDTLKKELIDNNRIEIRGFGSFSIRKRRMPRNNNTIFNTIYYRISKEIVDKLNKKQPSLE